jgi:ParB family chromosome partitioning protein
MITEIPLSQIHATYLNVRKTGGASIDDLAASIAHHGLIHNLVVTQHDGGFAVVAGGRRLKALQALQEAGTLPDALTTGIPCRVVDDAQGHEASLAENVMRQAMHPADEFDAFAKLVTDGLTIGEVAARFGKPELFVKQRLKLANVAPDILADYRAGNATLEQMMALALTDDQALQSRIWRGAKGWQREPQRLRESITATELSTESRLGKFVGLAAYEKAGGIVHRDMFAEDGEAFLQDAELVATLVTEKLERTVAKMLKEGWLWAEARAEFDYSDERVFGKIYPTPSKGNKEMWPEEAKATAGVIVTIGYNGQTEIKRGLVRAQDRKAAAVASGDKEITGGKKLNVPGELSFAAVQRLQAEATGILQAEIAEMPRTALALLAAELASRAFYDHSDYGTAQRQWVHIQREHSGRMPGNLRDLIPESVAGKRFAEAEQAWKERLPKKKAELREWLLAQDFDTIAKLLAFLSARELDLVDGSPDSKQGVTDAAAAAKIDLAELWKPTEEWLATLPKAVVIAMVTDAAGKVAAAPLDKLKKAQLPQAAISLFPAGWLPKPLRPHAAKKAGKNRKAEADPA